MLLEPTFADPVEEAKLKVEKEKEVEEYESLMKCIEEEFK